MSKEEKFKKVVEYKTREGDLLESVFTGIGSMNNFWFNSIRDWIFGILVVIFMPIAIIPMRFEFKKKVYWRKVK